MSIGITQVSRGFVGKWSKMGLGFSAVRMTSAAMSTLSSQQGSISVVSGVTNEQSGYYNYKSSANGSRAKYASQFVAASLTAAVLCGGIGSAVLCEAPHQPDYAQVRKSITKIIEDDDKWGPTFVRLAWHTSGTFDKMSNTGGSDGATIRFDPEASYGANAGLTLAMAELEPVKKEFGTALSYGDLYTLSGVVAIEAMGGPSIPWRSGRVDAANGSLCTPDGRLPDAEKDVANRGTIAGTVQHLRDIFYRMGFNDQEIVALAGAHALGRCHPSRSGYSGPWTRAPTTFSNAYFTELLDNKWTLKKWDGPVQFEDPTGDLMMLPSDMALIWDSEFRKWVEIYAKDEEKFYADFSKAFQKLEENGVKAFDKSLQEAVSKKKSWWN